MSWLRADPSEGGTHCDFDGGTGARGARSYGGRGTGEKSSGSRSWAGKPSPQMEAVGFLPRIRACLRRADSFFAQVVPLFVLILLFVPITPARSAQFSDVTLKTGVQLNDELTDILKNRDVDLLVKRFISDQFVVSHRELTKLDFIADNPQGKYTLFFIPFRRRPPPPPRARPHRQEYYADARDGAVGLVVYAQGPKGAKVFSGDVLATTERPTNVVGEMEVVDGKVREGHGSLKNFFKCAAAGCAPAAAGCILGGPEWLPCFCLWCGGSVASCGLLELFVP